MRVITFTAVLAATMIAAALPLAAAAEGISLGANVGSARVNQGDFEGDDTGWKAHFGGSFTQIIGGEIGYVDFGHLGGNNGPRANAWTPAITVGLPLGMVNLYAKGGVAFADVEGSSVREEYKNNDPFYGVGMRVSLNPANRNSGLGLRAEYERYQFDREDIDMMQAGIELLFGN